MNGGGGGGGNTTYSWNPTMAAYWQGNGDFPGYLDIANRELLGTYQKGYQGYDGERVTGLSDYEKKAASGINDLVYRQEAMPDVWAGRQAATDFAQGNVQNAYKGMDNPAFQQVLNSGLEDITNSYQKTTAKDLDHLMAQSGMLGSSAHTGALADNQAALGKTISNYVSGMRNDQFNRSASMEEGDLGRRMQAIPLAQAGQGLSTDLYSRLAQAGQAQRGIDQQRADFNYGEWQNKQNFGRNQLDWMGNFLSRAQGGIGGSVNMYGGGGNGLGSALGTALMGYGMFRS